MIEFDVRTDGIENIAYRLHERASRAEVWLANEIMKDTRPYVPALTLSQANKTRYERLMDRTHTEGNKVIYPGPYARYLYFGKALKGPPQGPKYATDKNLVYTKSVHPQAQSFWFEASKAQNMGKWEKGVKKLVGK